MVIVKNRQLLFSNRENYIGTEYDNNSTNMVFSLDRINEDGFDMGDLTYRVDLHYSDTDTTDTAIVEADTDKLFVRLTWTITASVMAHKGTHFIQLRAFDDTGTFKWSSYKNVIYIEDALTSVPAGSTLTELEQLEAKFENVDAAEAARVTAEAARAEAEAKRDDAETAREAAETERVAAEEARASAEAARKAEFEKNEAERTATFTESEGSREATFDAAINEFNDTKDELKGFATEAESYAHGSTGSRTGEDTDNAKYYADLARQYEETASKTDVGTLTKLIEAVEKAEQTVEENLTAVNHDTNIYPAFVVDRLANVTDLNVCTTNGIYQFTAAASNNPVSAVGMVLVLNSTGSGETGYIAQYAWEGSDAHTLYARDDHGGTWGAWERISPEVVQSLSTSTADVPSCAAVNTVFKEQQTTITDHETRISSMEKYSLPYTVVSTF